MEEGKFVTAFFCVLDHAAHRLRFSNAGHNPPVLMRASGETQLLEVGGLILGFMENTEFEEQACDIRLGDLLVIYSDGISESANAQGDEFGVEGIMDVIRRHRRSSAQEILGAIMRAATAFAGDQPQLDDMTMIVLKRD
jgi:sigma-B regulation protein RsbU (phosphoserine phosphatase)